ncbi:hypothetical protein LJR219_000377 [Phenylobacterium sp. LjRoot219]|uniref:hypothetical protein n=1 Tax=Phenylobacterium sp. LjRoot219 TaxID=3342283 RepID=UPI003ECD7495
MRSLRYARRAARLKLAARAVTAACVAFVGLNAQAAEPGVAAAFGNTVVSTYPDGTSQKIWLHPDGKWTGISRGNGPLAGSWSMRGEKVCLKQSQPPTLPVAYCTALPTNSQPGVQWASRDVAGRSITLSLMRGVPAQYQSGAAARH